MKYVQCKVNVFDLIDNVWLDLSASIDPSLKPLLEPLELRLLLPAVCVFPLHWVSLLNVASQPQHDQYQSFCLGTRHSDFINYL